MVAHVAVIQEDPGLNVGGAEIFSLKNLFNEQTKKKVNNNKNLNYIGWPQTKKNYSNKSRVARQDNFGRSGQSWREIGDLDWCSGLKKALRPIFNPSLSKCTES